MDFPKEHSGSHQKNSMQHVFLSPDHPAYINEAEYAHPFLYLNGSLFVGNKGEHHGNVITRHELNKWPHPWSDENTDGRAIPEEGIYWTGLHGDSPGLADALDQHFFLEHEAAYEDDRCWVKLKDGRVFKGMTHWELIKLLEEHDIPMTEVETFGGGDLAPYWNNLLRYEGSHLGASEYNVQKYVWFDGKMIVTPPQYMHDEPYHATLAQDVGYRWDDPNATIEFGYYFPDDDSLRAYHEKGEDLPAEQELKEFIRAHPKGNLETVFPKDHQASIEPEHLPEDATYPVDNLILQHADPIAGQAGEWENQRVPFLYLPDKQYLYYGNPGDHHFGLTMKASNDHPDIWDTPHISGFLKQDGTHKIFNSMVWPNAIKPHMELLKQQLSDESVHSARAKQAALHKFVWADGKFAVTPDIQRDPGLMHHGDLVDELGFGDSFGPMAQNIVAGEYYYPGNMEIVYQRGKHPDKAQLAYLVQTTEPVPLYSDSPTKQAVALFPFHKYVWADGKIAVGPRVETDSVRPWHTDLMSSMGYNYQTNMPEEWNVGYYYPHDHSTYEIDSTENVPDEYSIVKQIHNHLEDGDVHAPRSSAMEITRDNPWIRTKDGRYFEGVHGQSSHMQLMWDNHIDPEEVAEYGGGEMAYYWNSTVTSVYHPYECQAANYFIDTM